MCYTLEVDSRNITLSLPSELIRQAKVYAAERDLTINTLVRHLLQEKLASEDRARAAGERLLALAAEGPYFSIEPSSISREEIYERR